MKLTKGDHLYGYITMINLLIRGSCIYNTSLSNLKTALHMLDKLGSYRTLITMSIITHHDSSRNLDSPSYYVFFVFLMVIFKS